MNRTRRPLAGCRPAAAMRRRSGRRCGRAAIDGAPPRYRRERWPTPDGDFVDVDWLGRRPATRRCWCCSTASKARAASHYAQAFATPRERARLALRRCRTFAAARASSTSRRAPTTRATTKRSAGCSRACAHRTRGPIVAVGVSLGGNALLRWAEEAGDSGVATRARGVRGVVADRPRGRRPRDRARLQPAGLHAHVPAHDATEGARASWRSIPGLFDRERMLAARDLYEFDNLFTAPLHGFRDTDDYWSRASAKPHLHRIRVPALVAQRAQRSVRAGVSLPRHGEVGALRDAVAAGARRPRRLSRRPLSRRTAVPARAVTLWLRRTLSDEDAAGRHGRDRQGRARASGPTCRTATAGSLSMRAATGTCATTAFRPPGRSRRSKAAASIMRSCANSSTATTTTTRPAAGSSRTARSASMSSSKRRHGCGGCAATADGVRLDQPHRPAGARSNRPGSTRRAGCSPATDLGLGIVHTLDMELAGDAVERGAWAVRPCASTSCPSASAIV